MEKAGHGILLSICVVKEGAMKTGWNVGGGELEPFCMYSKYRLSSTWEYVVVLSAQREGIYVLMYWERTAVER